MYYTALASVQGQILSAIGFNQLLHTKVLSIFRFFILDFWVLFVSGLIYMVTSQVQRKYIHRKRAKDELKMQHHARLDTSEDGKTVTFGKSSCSSISEPSSLTTSGTKLPSSSASKRSRRIKKSLIVIRYTAEVLFIALLCLAGILNPSLTSLFYFISFLFIVTYISCNFKLNPIYNSFPFLTCALVSLQIIALFLYQIKFFRNLVPPSNLEARYVHRVVSSSAIIFLLFKRFKKVKSKNVNSLKICILILSHSFRQKQKPCDD